MMKVNSLYCPILILLLLIPVPSFADTERVGSNTFESEGQVLDTGYLSRSLKNDSTTVTTVFIEISSIEINNSQIDRSNYSTSWEYFQTNTFSNISSENNTNGIKIDVDPSGFTRNQTSIVWRLLITSPLEGSIVVNLKITYAINFIATVPITNDLSGDTYSFPWVSFLVILIIFLSPTLLVLQQRKR